MRSPVQLQASATASPGHSINGWWVYVDNVGVYNRGAVSTIDPKIAINAGKHAVLVRAWDTSGNYGDQALSLTVNTTKPTVMISTPVNHATLGSPFPVQASATSSGGQKITGWWVYDNSQPVYNAGAVNAINPSLSMSTGTHNLVVRVWDTSGNYGDQTITVTVRRPTVRVKSPTGGTTLSSPIQVQASAVPPTGRSIGGWRVYLNGVCVFQGGATETIQPSVAARAGTHTLLIRAWDSSGAYGDRTLNIEVR